MIFRKVFKLNHSLLQLMVLLAVAQLRREDRTGLTTTVFGQKRAGRGYALKTEGLQEVLAWFLLPSCDYCNCQ